MESWSTRLKDGRIVTLRFLTPEDKSNVLRMFSTMSAEALRWSLPPYDEEWIDRKLASIKELIPLVAVHDNRIVGFCAINKFSHARRKGIGGAGIFLHQDFHDVGLGTAMMELVLDLAKKQGMRRIRLEVIEGNRAAVRLYEKVGFEVEGKMKSSFLGDDNKYHDSLIMAILLDV
jgi:putative acetyltransferase